MRNKEEEDANQIGKLILKFVDNVSTRNEVEEDANRFVKSIPKLVDNVSMQKKRKKMPIGLLTQF